MNLYELSHDMLRVKSLFDTMEISEGQLSDSEYKALEENATKLFELLEGNLEQKAEGYFFVIREYEAEAETIQTEIERLKTRMSVRKNKSQRLRNALRDALVMLGKNKVETERMTARVSPGRESLDIDMTQVDSWPAPILGITTKVERKVDKKALKELCEESIRKGLIPGAKFIVGEPILILK